MRRSGDIPASARSSRPPTSSSLRDPHAKDRILARDGFVSPVGSAIDESAPEEIRATDFDRVSPFEAANIIPLRASKYSIMQKLLSMFADTNVEAMLRGRRISSPSNMICMDHYTHLYFDEFAIGVEYLHERYWLRKLNLPRIVGGFIKQRANGEEVIFGLGPEGDRFALPDGELFNIHLAIGRVLHASGAGEVINKILMDEDDFNAGNVSDMAAAARISAFALKLELKRLQDSDDNKQRERSQDVLVKVSTNSQNG